MEQKKENEIDIAEEKDIAKPKRNFKELMKRAWLYVWDGEYIKSRFIPLAFISLFFAIMVLSAEGRHTDDAQFYEWTQTTLTSPIAFTRWFYNNWSSRVIINFLKFYMVQVFWVWQVVTIIVFIIFVLTLDYLFNTKKLTIVSWLLAIFLLFIPLFTFNSEAGWAATTVNFLYPITALLICLIPIKIFLSGSQTKKQRWLFLLLFPLVVLAANMEVGSIMLVASSFTLIVYFAFKKKWDPYLVMIFVIALASVIFHMVNPGNAARSAHYERLNRPWEGYSDYSVFRQLAVGILALSNFFMLFQRVLFLAFVSLLTIAVWRKHKNIMFRTIPLIPLVFSVLFMFRNLLWFTFRTFFHFGGRQGWGENFAYYAGFTFPGDTLFSLMPLVLVLTIYASILISIYLLFGNSEKTLLVLMVFCFGFFSWTASSITPVVFSGQRTMFKSAIAIICTAMLVLGECIKPSETKENKEVQQVHVARMIFVSFCVISLSVFILNFL